jgi:hypothetical protein
MVILFILFAFVLLTQAVAPYFDPSYPMPSSRDVLKWPFANTSIWNLPIGTGATYITL